MNRIFALLLFAITINSCGDKAEKEPGTASTTIADSTAARDTTDYLPVAQLLNEDIRNVETYAGGILRKLRSGNTKDSMYVQYRDFQLLAGQFLLKELDSAYFTNNFSEESLMDETSRMLNFIYTAKDTISPLRRVMVYIKPSMANDKIARIYMETTGKKDNNDVEKKMTWEIGKYFYIITTRQPPTGDPITTMEKLIWDPQHFSDN
jgi:hypothetical protein